jgi:predicted N-acetyltransferase YhbS
VIRIRPLIGADIPLGMRLKHQAGWNQTEADWARFLELEPEGCFVAEWNGAAAGTVTTCTFGPVAWIAMVLVEMSLRGRGLGQALMGHALSFLDQRGIPSIRLDATPLGQPLYEKLGFVAEYSLARFEGSPTPDKPLGLVAPASVKQLAAMVDVDRAATGTARGKLLERLFAEFPHEVRVVQRSGQLEGYIMARPGSRARFIGPCIATAKAGPLLLADALSRYAGQAVYIDIPSDNGEPQRLAQARGLRVQRPLLRMGRGPRVAENIPALWASSGPEMG